jgi:phosphoribosylanthranilate isomerase
MRIKICGITQPSQGIAISELGANALGFICVSASPRYITPNQIKSVVEVLPLTVDKIGVFANTIIEEIVRIITDAELTGVQLHGDESPAFCQQLRQHLPDIEIIKALRIHSWEALQKAHIYSCYVDTLLLDAYHPQQLGGTGKTLNWEMLQDFSPSKPWFLAGGLTPDNILDALSFVHPSGIDVSSGVERSPGDKDIDKVAKLFANLQSTEVD